MLTALPFAAVGLTLHVLVVGCALWRAYKVRSISGYIFRSTLPLRFSRAAGVAPSSTSFASSQSLSPRPVQ